MILKLKTYQVLTRTMRINLQFLIQSEFPILKISSANAKIIDCKKEGLTDFLVAQLSADIASKNSDKDYRVNQRIKADKVRIVFGGNNDGAESTVLSLNEAIKLAKDQGLDLIEIAPNAKPPVCKIMDMGKYKYDAQKKANKAKKKQKKIELKEIKLRPVTEVHDYSFKIKNAQKFIAKGDKVKFTIRFKGRELQHSSLGHELMDKIKIDMEAIGRVELQPKFDGKQMIMVIQPL